MPTFIYRTVDNQRVPSVTTINKIGQESGGLIHWAWSLGMDGKDYRTARDEAAEAGSVGHALVEAAIHNREPELDRASTDAVSAGRRAFEAYTLWRQHTRITMRHSEIPLVSEQHRFGGCIDAIAKGADGRLTLIDFKTGAVYPDHLCQVAAYKALWEENYPTQPIDGGIHLCRFNKETGDFAHHYFVDVSDAWEAFKLKRALYDHLQRLKKRV